MLDTAEKFRMSRVALCLSLNLLNTTNGVLTRGIQYEPRYLVLAERFDVSGKMQR